MLIKNDEVPDFFCHVNNSIGFVSKDQSRRSSLVLELTRFPNVMLNEKNSLCSSSRFMGDSHH